MYQCRATSRAIFGASCLVALLWVLAFLLLKYSYCRAAIAFRRQLRLVISMSNPPNIPFDAPHLSWPTRLSHIPWGLVALTMALGFLGVAMLYSAGGQNWQPWAAPTLIRLLVCALVMMVLALINVRFYLRFAYLFYAGCLALLLLVEIMGQIGMGAQRWINLGFIVLQPSELMKIALVLALARYFHNLDLVQRQNPFFLLAPIALLIAPVALVLLQPNLGTALLLVLAAITLFWVAGARWWLFALGLALVLASIPVVWEFMHDYQKQRVLTFLNPESDPAGAGYNILQSTIALGAGGFAGRGFGLGTQSQLQFLPEKHTDFIFVVLGEELGWLGAVGTLILYTLVLAYSFLIAAGAKHTFTRLLAIGLGANIFLYVIVNVAMVSGLIPVVGIPLPPLSFGGTAMLAFMTMIGLLLSVAVHRDTRLGKS